MKTQKSLVILAALLVLLGIQLSLAVSKSSALDNPHNADNTVSCASCHDSTQANNTTWWTDQGNGVCSKCHNGIFKPLKTVHQDKLGNTLAQCTQCHNPHTQQQNRIWKTASYLYTGTSDTLASSVTSSTLTQTGANWSAINGGNLTGYLLLPDVRYNAFIYRIVSNTANTITVDTTGGGINLTYCKPGATFAIVLGKLVKENVNGSNVLFFRETGTNSFVDTSGTIDGICQVCHTTTPYFNTQGVLDAGGTGSHPAVIGTAQKCSDCHNHQAGFKPSCNQCHGSPPVDAATLITKDKNGTAVTSNSPGPGAHNDHVTTGGLTCQNCHTGGMLGGANQGDNKINIGFTLNGSNLTGTYDTTTTGATRSVYPVIGAATTTVTYGGTLQCSNLYCHDPGKIGQKSPSWLGTLQDRAGCDSCHGGNSTATVVNGSVGPMSTGKHTNHINNANPLLGTFACGRCHAATVTTGNDRAITGASNHVNGTKDVVYDSLNPGATSNSCSNIYCHSNGKGTIQSAVTYTDWYNTTWATVCNKCHGTSNAYGAPDYATGGGGAANANSHGVAAHASSSADCIKCHTNTTTTGTSITGTLHLNQTIDVTIGSSYAIGGVSTGHYNAAVGSKTCSTVTCHGSLSPKWGTDLTGANIATCTKCHGQQTVISAYTLTNAAPGAGGTGQDTAGNTSNTSPKVGAHRAHLEATHTYSLAINCNECHTVPGAFSDPGHISSNGTTSVPLAGTLADTNTRTVPGTPTYSAGQCSNVYCHDSSRFKNGWSNVTGTVPQPIWNTTLLAGGVPSDCGKCHGYPPDTSSGKHPNNTSCHSCHQHVNSTDNGFLPANTPVTGGVEKHVNGLIEGGGCDTCHGNPPTTNTYSPSAPSTGLLGSAYNNGDTGATNPITPGAHDKHVNALTGRHMTCDACHAGYTSMGDHNLKMGFKVDGTTYPNFIGSANTGVFTGWTMTAGTYGLKSGYTWSVVYSGTTITTTTSYAAANTCAVYCHGAGTTGKPALTGGAYSAATWSDTTTAACGACHGASSANPPTTGKHGKHAGTYAFACATCHNSTPLDGSHVNGNVAWQFNTADPRVTTSSTYNSANSGSTGTLAPSASYGSCATIYCHSNGTSTTVFTPNVTPYSWATTTSLPADCTGCHNGNAGATVTMASNKHAQHVNNASKVGQNVACGTCHNATVASSNDRAITNTANHANRSLNIKFDSGGINYNSDNPTYSGQSTTGANGAAVLPSTKGACSNVYCHSSGNVNNAGVAVAPTTYMTVTWDSASAALGCDGCHGNQAGKAHPTYASGAAGSQTANSHGRHVESNGYSCDYCHVSTTTDTAKYPALPTTVVTAGGTHLNRSDDVSFKVNGGKTGTYNPTNPSAKTCSATYCHGSVSPQWGAAGSTNCASCHQSQGAGGTATWSGKHQRHVSTYNFSCEMCHAVAGTNHASGPTGTAGQTAEISFTNQSASWVSGVSYRGSATLYSYRSLTVSPYGDGALTPGYAAGGSIVSDTTNTTITYTASGSCSNIWCHSNANPVSGGTLSYATPTWGATLTCGSCHNQAGDASPKWSGPHNKHITSYAANTNITCSACHNGTVSIGNTTLITGSTSSHVNASKDVIYNPSWVASNGTYTSGVGCQNTYCHSNGTNIAAAPYSTGTVSWQTPLPGGPCASCHGIGTTNGMPNYTSGGANKTNSHVAHVTTENYTCYDCHSNTVTSSSNAISNFANHVNKSYDVNGATFSAVAYTYIPAGSTCSTKCHGTSSSPAWGNNFSGYDACVKCHGTVTGVIGATGSVLTTVTGSSYPWSPNAWKSAPSPTANPSGLFTDLSNTRVGTHQQHLTTNPYRGPIACAECHTVPSQPVSAGHMSGLPATLTFPGAVSSYLVNTYQGTNIPNAAYANGTCSNTYCHNGTYIKNGWSSGQTGTVPAPTWSNTTMLNQTTPTATDCGICHGYPPAGAHSTSTTCSSCHSHVAANNLSFADISKHMDGAVQGGGCNGCHWYDTTDAGAWTTTRGSDPALTNTSAAWGAHVKHINHLKAINGGITLNATSDSFGAGNFNLVCGVCHDQTKTLNHKPDGGATTRNIDFNGSTLHLFGSSPTPTYNFNTITQTGTRSCSSLDCHYQTTPVW